MQRESAVAMLNTMARMQDQHNVQVHPQWREQDFDYYRAIWVECAEMLDHFGWKWWKKQDADIDQVKLELVDIWHFALSELLRADTLSDEMGVSLAAVEVTDGSDPEAFRCSIEVLAQSSLASQSFELTPFIDAMRLLPMTYLELFDMYIGKNVLNQFRQSNGYQDGSYRKVWHGREDNEHLVEVLAEISADPDELAPQLYAALQERYSLSSD